jgi:hypothetical protein
MAILSNINGKFRVDSAGAVYFGTSAGTNLQVLQSIGTGGSPTWVNVDDIIGGPYLPIAGGVLEGATSTDTGISFTVGGNLFVTGTSTLTGALSGAGATFTGTVLIDGVSNYTGLEVKGSGSSRPQIKFSNVNQGVLGQIYGTEANALVTTTIAGLEYQVRNANGTSGDHVFKSYNTAILTLNGATNAATFAGRINGVVGGTAYNTAGLWLQGNSSTDGISIGGTGGGNKNIDTYGGALNLQETAQNGVNMWGNVGIGLTTPTGNLSMNSQIGNGTNPPTSYTTNTAATRYQSFFNSYYTSATDGLGPYPRYCDMVATGSPDGTNGGSNIRFFTTGIVAATGAVERMRITSGGIVNIGGTTGNGSRFNIIGDTTTSVGYNQMNIANANGAWGLLLGFGNGQATGNYHGLNHAAIINVQSAPLHLGTSNSRVLTILANGKVGIGTTVTDEAKLIVEASTEIPTGGWYNEFGNLHVTTDTQGINNGGTISMGGLGRTAGPTEYFRYAQISGRAESGSNGSPQGYMAFETTSGVTNITTERIRINSSGNVGIGTPSPDFALDIEAISSGVQLQMGRISTNVGSAWMGASGSGFALGVGAYGAGNSVTDPKGFLIDASGNLSTRRRIQAKTDTGVGASVTRNMFISWGGASYDYTFDPVAVFGSNQSGGTLGIRVSGWPTRLFDGIIIWRNNGGGSSKLGTGVVTLVQIATNDFSGVGVTVSLPSVNTNEIKISFTGWHSNDHGWSCYIKNDF